MSRMVVLQADARRRGGLRAPLAVGVARWRGEGEAAAVVVKATLGFDTNGEQVTARMAEPAGIEAPVPNELGPGSYRNPDDFVLVKAERDVLLVGHAHAPEPRERIDVAVAIGAWRGHCEVRSEPAAQQIPLVGSRCLQEGRPTRVGPGFVEREGEHDAPGSGEPFQAAEPGWRMPLEAPLDRIELTGLSPRGGHRVLDLPSLWPRAFFERRDGRLVEVALRCDTVLLDVDFERVSLVWRGRIPEDDLRYVDRLVASLEPVEERRELAAILRELPRGTIAFATEEEGAAAGDPDELAMARLETLGHGAEPELSLDDYARITATLAEERQPRGEVLRDAGYDETTWTIEDRAWAEAMLRAEPDDPEALPVRYGDAFVRAQGELAGPDEPRAVDVYVRLKRRLQRGERPDEVLREVGVTKGEWMRLERHWLEVAARDPAIAATITG